jgi:hypothetical protein
MKWKGKEIRCKKLDEWLGGVSLEEKIKTLETGRLLTCTKCGLTVYDKEKPKDRIRRKCNPSGSEHSFVECEHYIILRRGFSGIIDVANYWFGTPEEAVIGYFKDSR